MVVDTIFTVPYPLDRTVIAVQDTVDRLGWRVLTIASQEITVTCPPVSAMSSGGPKLKVLMQESADETRLRISVSHAMAFGPVWKKILTGYMGQFVNSISLRVQTNSIAINPTVSVGEGQGASEEGRGSQSQDAASDRISQLERLKALLDAGVLDQSEFEAEKRRVLG